MGGQRDAGLVRALGPLGLAGGIISMMIGAGIFAVPSALADSLGPYAPLAFLACAVGIGAVAICWAEGGSRMPTSGGIYGYVEAALGPLAGTSRARSCGSATSSLSPVSLRPSPTSRRAWCPRLS